MRFAPDGRIFVAQKPGGIKVFDGLGDTDADVVANLRPEVDHNWDRGMLGLALDPDFPARPFIYVLYTYDAPIGGTAPTWNDTARPRPAPPRTAAWTARGCRASSSTATTGRARAGADRGLVPAGAHPHDRRPRTSAPTAPFT